MLWARVVRGSISRLKTVTPFVAHSCIKDWLNKCFSIVNKNWEDHVILNKNFVAEYEKLVSDPSVIFSLGWKPKTSFEELAKIMMK